MDFQTQDLRVTQGDHCPHTRCARTPDSLRLCTQCGVWLNVLGGVIDLKIYDKNYKRAEKAKRRQRYIEDARREEEEEDD